MKLASSIGKAYHLVVQPKCKALKARAIGTTPTNPLTSLALQVDKKWVGGQKQYWTMVAKAIIKSLKKPTHPHLGKIGAHKLRRYTRNGELVLPLFPNRKEQ